MDSNLGGDDEIQTVSALENIGNRSANLQGTKSGLSYKHRRTVSMRPRTHHTQELLAGSDGSIKTDWESENSPKSLQSFRIRRSPLSVRMKNWEIISASRYSKQ